MGSSLSYLRLHGAFGMPVALEYIVPSPAWTMLRCRCKDDTDDKADHLRRMKIPEGANKIRFCRASANPHLVEFA
jgi:hypothetical protein